MSSELQLSELGAHQLPDLTAAEEYFRAAQNERTRRAYDGDFRKFEAWCQKQPGAGVHWRVCPAPVPVVAAFVAACADAGEAVASIRRYLASIAVRHHDAGVPSPTSHPAIARVLRGIARTHARPQRQAEPLMPEHVRHAVYQITRVQMMRPGPPRPGLHEARDRAVLLVGWCAGLRHGELAALNADDITFDNRGSVVRQARSKTDQEGAGHFIRLPQKDADPLTCPTWALREWLNHHARPPIAGDGPLFIEVRGGRAQLRDGKPVRMSPHAVPRLVKRAAVLNGLQAAQFSGHSLRAGLITAASLAGAQDSAIMDVTGHRSKDTLRKYQRKLHLQGRALADGLL